MGILLGSWTLGTLFVLLGVFSNSGALVFLGICVGFGGTFLAIGVRPASETEVVSTPQTQSRYIANSVRGLILQRQGGTCGHPGCMEIRNLQLHHLHPISLGGTNNPENLIYLCPNHHHMYQRGEDVSRYTKPMSARW
jgi:hypothetical protein